MLQAFPRCCHVRHFPAWRSLSFFLSGFLSEILQFLRAVTLQLAVWSAALHMLTELAFGIADWRALIEVHDNENLECLCALGLQKLVRKVSGGEFDLGHNPPC